MLTIGNEKLSFSDCPIKSMILNDNSLTISFKKAYFIEQVKFLKDIDLFIKYADIEIVQNIQIEPFEPAISVKVTKSDAEYLSEVCEICTTENQLNISGFGVDTGRWTTFKMTDFETDFRKHE